jgi:hypothetical protein
MYPTAELIGAVVTLVALGFLTLASVRSIGRRRAACPGIGARGCPPATTRV